jgi:hypothetical protein
MAISLKSTRDFIEMYEMQDVLTVLKCANGYQVSHAVAVDDYNIYVCKNINAAAECVNDIIFNRTPMNVTLVEERT